MRIAVTGLGRGENPQPGAGIVASLRAAHPDAFIVGMAYDAMESGIYANGGPDVVFTMPYPTAGAEAFLHRLDAVLASAPFDIFIPTLDSELDLIVNLEDEFRARGIRTCLPGKEAFRRRMKDRLPALARAADVSTPRTEAAHTLGQVMQLGRQMEFPLLVKGCYYDARLVNNEAELAAAATELLAEWGAPVLMQERVHGAEFNAMGIGDGEGGIIGLCCIRKTIVSSKGKGLGGITVSDPALTAVCQRLIRELRWKGPFEIEVMKDDVTREHHLIEINPRFPAWVGFPTGFGINFPAALTAFAMTGTPPPALPEAAPGWFYLRHQVEVLGQTSQLAALSAEGSWPGEPLQPLTARFS